MMQNTKINSAIFSTKYNNDWIIKYKDIIDSVESHLAYEKEFKEEVTRSENFLEYYNAEKYILEISKAAFIKKEPKPQVIYKLSRIIIFDISNYKNITEQIYGELVCCLINMAAANYIQKNNSFLKEMYLEYSRSPYNSQKEELQILLKKYLRIYEEHLLRNEKNTKTNADEKIFHHTASTDSSDKQNLHSNDYTKESNMYKETENDIYGARKVLDVLYKYKITDKKTITRLLKNASLLGLGLRLLLIFVVALIITTLLLESEYWNEELQAIISAISFILVIFNIIKTIVFKIKLRNVRNIVRQVMNAAKVGESYLFSTLTSQYGKNLSKIIQ